ncbi:TetR/AcrR family transcriptional regulator [Streptacidiphilus cavernicola]|uniref:TetR/AcrR family transcriptional regulator n=1 Tax=Streptacidiphilus cavernicola TaxID=3342716 RepID=A0ABV6VMX0_9ACTN
MDRGQALELELAWQEIQPDAARRLLIAAVEAFASRGFHATTTRDIASGAGMSPAGLYVHYRSKEELLHRITLVGHQHTLRLINAALAGAGTPVDRLRAVVGDLTAWHARHHTTTRVIEYELHSLSAEHRAEILLLRREIDGLVRAVLADGAARGDFDVPDVPATTVALLSLSVDVARWYHQPARLTPERLGRLYADLALRMAGAEA